MLGLSWDAQALQAQFCNGLAGRNVLVSLTHKRPFSGSTEASKCQVSSPWQWLEACPCCTAEAASVCTSCRSGCAGRAWLDIPSATEGWRPALALAEAGVSRHMCTLTHMCSQTHAKSEASIRLVHEDGCTLLLPVPSSLLGVFHQREKVSGRESQWYHRTASRG